MIKNLPKGLELHNYNPMEKFSEDGIIFGNQKDDNFSKSQQESEKIMRTLMIKKSKNKEKIKIINARWWENNKEFLKLKKE